VWHKFCGFPIDTASRVSANNHGSGASTDPTASSRRRNLNRHWIAFRGYGFTLLFLALWALAAWFCRPADRLIPFHIPSQFKGLGIILVIIGVELSFATASNFASKGRGTPALFDPPKEFVAQGLNRYVRNPMYIGYVTGILGMGLVFRSEAIVLFAVVVFGLIHAFVVFAEEPGLRRRFGQPYEDYCRAVPRWMPRFTPPQLPT
jgi:protein-S-isoprenylcysteine O-methyltransferase Ste14